MSTDVFPPRGIDTRYDWVLPQWPAPARVRAIATTRRGPGESITPFDRFNLGLNTGDYPESAQSNREALVDALKLPSMPRWLKQVHGADVVEISKAQAERDDPAADAAITREPGVVLAVLSADCLPVLIASEHAAEIAVVHAGWRGLAAGVIEATIAKLRTPTPQLLAWLGPAIGADAYVVGNDVRDAMLASAAQAASAFRPHTSTGKWHCDLYALARQRLAALGIARVSGGEHCTHDDAMRFYSYRRERETGRMASLIWLSR